MERLLRHSIKNWRLKKKFNAIPKSNFTKNETDALQKLSQRDDIIMTKVNKGRAVAIIDIGDYIRECNRQLNTQIFIKDTK